MLIGDEEVLKESGKALKVDGKSVNGKWGGDKELRKAMEMVSKL